MSTLVVALGDVPALVGGEFYPTSVGVSVFLLASAATFSRFIPVIKARFDYGAVIFILASVPGYRVEEIDRYGVSKTVYNCDGPPEFIKKRLSDLCLRSLHHRNQNRSLKIPKNDKGEPISTTTPIPVVELIPFATFASLLIEIGARVKIIVEAVEEVETMAEFKLSTDDKPEQNQMVLVKAGEVVLGGAKSNSHNTLALDAIPGIAPFHAKLYGCETLVAGIAHGGGGSPKNRESALLPQKCNRNAPQSGQRRVPIRDGSVRVATVRTLSCFKSGILVAAVKICCARSTCRRCCRCCRMSCRRTSDLRVAPARRICLPSPVLIAVPLHVNQGFYLFIHLLTDSTLSEKIVQKILSGYQVSLDDLSAEEKKQFQRAVASGELSKLIEPWEPWWLKPSARTISLRRRRQPLAEQETATSPPDGSESDLSCDIPCDPETPLPPVSKLSSAEPSPLLAVQVVDIIYSYCFTLCLHNGDWQSDPIGSATVVLSVSSVLREGGLLETLLEALSHCLEQTCSPAFGHMGGLQFGLGPLDKEQAPACGEKDLLYYVLGLMSRLEKLGLPCQPL
ncbi:HIT-type Zinc finger family protein [Actinidia rufa]|uniref:HIT-type Zinc finger family protein n=1 Tax=Actinidia rufa TaxID=165716 RepID=A0A7J0GQ59_9ERIC|nr:HIT-type Zinc finger family protein [Actinidia rufa]